VAGGKHVVHRKKFKYTMGKAKEKKEKRRSNGGKELEVFKY
jgi:hypothetical protein